MKKLDEKVEDAAVYSIILIAVVVVIVYIFVRG